MERSILRAIDLTRRITSRTSLAVDEVRHDTGWTRIEAPGFTLRGGRMLSDLDPAVFITSGVLLDLSHKQPEQSIDDEDLEGAEEGAGLAVREGEIVLMRTQQTQTSPKPPATYPTLSTNGVEYLEFKHASAVGTDAPSVDRLEAGTLKIHKGLFERGMFVIENLCNLERLEETRFQLVALPLNLSTGVSPARVIALLDQNEGLKR
jgi:kynurenine formamidase